jgi:hypothetical protein
LSEQIDRVLIAIIPMVIIVHDSLRVSVAAHHLALPVVEALGECAQDLCLLQINREVFTIPGICSFKRD